MPRKLTRSEATAMAALRKVYAGGPRKKGTRCPCGLMSVKRAKARFHHC